MEVAVPLHHLPEGDSVVEWVLFGLSALIPLVIVATPVILAIREATRRRRESNRPRCVEVPDSHIGVRGLRIAGLGPRSAAGCLDVIGRGRYMAR